MKQNSIELKFCTISKYHSLPFNFVKNFSEHNSNLDLSEMNEISNNLTITCQNSGVYMTHFTYIQRWIKAY
jgi:hypothetical protein